MPFAFNAVELYVVNCTLMENIGHVLRKSARHWNTIRKHQKLQISKEPTAVGKTTLISIK